MRQIFLLLVLLSIVSIAVTQNAICTNGFTLVNNKCLRYFQEPLTHKSATSRCSSYAGTLVTIKNGIDNRAISTIVGNANKHVWIGLYCFQNDPSNCLWDDESGSASSYNSFARSFPYTDVGNCVYYSVTGSLAGQWASGDCDEDLRPFVCEMPSTFQDYSCNLNFDGNCYIPSRDLAGERTFTINDAQSFCEGVCANLVSIHSPNEIRFIKNFYGNYSSIFIGALSTSKYISWIDGTTWDYNNIDKSVQQSGNCMIMALTTNGNMLQGAWYHSDCLGLYKFMCKRPVGVQCGGTTTSATVTVTPNPSNSPGCNTFIMAPGSFASPNYPGNYTNNLNCSYSLATLGSYRIRLTFSSVYTESCCDKIRVYDGDSTDSRIIDTIFGKSSAPLRYESSSNTMYVTFTTDGSVVGPGFSANFLSVI